MTDELDENTKALMQVRNYFLSIMRRMDFLAADVEHLCEQIDYVTNRLGGYRADDVLREDD